MQTSHITFFIGLNKDKNGDNIPADEAIDAIEDICKMIAENFGGFSMSNVSGGWVNDDGELMEAVSARIEADITNPVHARENQNIKAKARVIAELANRRLNQECTLVRISQGESFLA
jgi:hypothetical protein